MKEIYDVLKSITLFEGISLSDFEKILACLSPIQKRIHKSEIIINTGDRVDYIYIILSGSVKVVKNNIDGKENILTKLSVSEIFGEVFACATMMHSTVTVISLEESELLFFDYNRMITTCSYACPSHAKVIGNMLTLLANKNLMLHQKIELLSKRTTRERLLLYFDMQRGMAKKFTIPHSREHLAAFLCVDRSALSNECSKMQKEGIIKYNKNQFEIL